MVGFQIEFSAKKSFLFTPLKTAELEPFAFQNSITQSEMFMPHIEIFFVMQSTCRIDGWIPD
jgi:hypothetical protein